VIFDYSVIIVKELAGKEKKEVPEVARFWNFLWSFG